MAIKILDKVKQGSFATLEMMKNETDIMDKLNHPNIIRLYEVIETLDKFFCVMEYVDGMYPGSNSELPMFGLGLGI